MVAGRPDYTSQVLIKGDNAGVLRNVGLDSAGNMLTLMRGQYGGAPVTVAVDATGKLYGLLQGDYAGALKTLAVDSQGRMLAVLTDPEDVFGNPHYLGAAELAARLGSPVCLDRRGQVIFADPGGLNKDLYAISLTGAASAVIESASPGGLMGLCYALTAGPAAGNGPVLIKRVPLVSEGAVGVECIMALHKDAAYWTLGINEEGWAATKQGAIRYDVQGIRMQYYNSSGVWTELAGLAVYPDNSTPHVMKLVLNPITGKYVRALFDSKSWDLSAYNLYTPFATGARYLQAGISVTCGSSGTCTSYLSNIIITCNES